MAANVAANIASLSLDVEVVTLFPKEPSVKTRYVDRKTNHHFLRIDQDSTCQPLSIADFCHIFNDVIRPFDVVVLSSYGKGYLNESNMEAISILCSTRGIPIYADVKDLLGDWSRNITVVKINDVELAAHKKANIAPWKCCGTLLVTKGADGIDAYRSNGNVLIHSPSVNVPVTDSAGCGDSTLAGLVVAYLEGKEIHEAMAFANKVGAVAVSKPGVVAVKRGEVT
jgi:bifunctional ADP-heptose synthase (sugar kinase/adenylyltransferase)